MTDSDRSGATNSAAGGEDTRSVRSLLLPLQQIQLLVPSALVAEVGESLPGVLPAEGPSWLTGMVEWRGKAVPLVDFEGLLNGGRSAQGTRLAVLNTLNKNPNLPFVGMALHGIPRVIRASDEVVRPADIGSGPEPFVLARVVVQQQSALIPDLDALEESLLKTVASA